MRSVKALVAATFLALAALFSFAAPANATGYDPDNTPSPRAVSCSGTISYSDTIAGIGELVIYYNSSNGGTNSACFYHRGAAYGVAAPTEVGITRCTERSGEGQPCTPATSWDVDEGNFSYYAGPVGVTGTANYCVAAYGRIIWNDTFYQIGSGRQGCPN